MPEDIRILQDDELDEELENAYFLDEADSPAEQKKKIEEWVQAQVDVLLGENDDGKLSMTKTKQHG